MNQFVIPKTFKGAQLTQFGNELQVVDIETPQLEPEQVLIKVEAAPVNPSDLSAIAGHYPSGRKLPHIAGFEGSGFVAQLGENVKNVKVGDRVSFYTQSQFGTYGQYSIAQSQSLIILDNDVSFEAGASAIVNPVTVLCMLEETKQKGGKAVVQSAAASSLGRMFVKLFQENGIEVINVVRRQEQEDLLKSEGAKHILNQTSETFFKDLHLLATKLEATLFFDAIGGQFTGQVLEQLPNKSTAYLYGLLSGQNVGHVTANDMIFKGKTVRGFWLTAQLHSYNPFSDQNAQKQLNNLLKTHLKTEYGKEFKLDDIVEGIKFYQENQTQRKILIRPNQQ